MSRQTHAKLFFGFCYYEDTGFPQSVKDKLDIDDPDDTDTVLAKFDCRMVCCGDDSYVFWGLAHNKLYYSCHYKRLEDLEVEQKQIKQLLEAAEAVGWPTEKDPAWHLTMMTF